MKRRTFLTSVTFLISSVSMLLSITLSKKALTNPKKHVKIVQNQMPTDAVNVKQFGLLIAGITNNLKTIADNTATIQAAIDAVGKKGGGTVYIPAGTVPNCSSKFDS